jgi:membrane-associated phospholipid phosphatase
MSTGNHYWLDVAAGIAIAILTGYALRRVRTLRAQRA